MAVVPILAAFLLVGVVRCVSSLSVHTRVSYRTLNWFVRGLHTLYSLQERYGRSRATFYCKLVSDAFQSCRRNRRRNYVHHFPCCPPSSFRIMNVKTQTPADIWARVVVRSTPGMGGDFICSSDFSWVDGTPHIFLMEWRSPPQVSFTDQHFCVPQSAQEFGAGVPSFLAAFSQGMSCASKGARHLEQVKSTFPAPCGDFRYNVQSATVDIP